MVLLPITFFKKKLEEIPQTFINEKLGKTAWRTSLRCGETSPLTMKNQ